MSEYDAENVKRIWSNIAPSIESISTITLAAIKTPTDGQLRNYSDSLPIAFTAIINQLDDISVVFSSVPTDIKVNAGKVKDSVKLVSESTVKWYKAATTGTLTCVSVTDLERTVSDIMTTLQSMYGYFHLFEASIPDKKTRLLADFQTILAAIQAAIIQHVYNTVEIVQNFILTKYHFPSQVLLNTSAILKTNLKRLISVLVMVNVDDYSSASDLLTYSIININLNNTLPNVLSADAAEISIYLSSTNFVREQSTKYVEVINRLSTDAKLLKAAKNSNVLSTFMIDIDKTLTAMNEEFDNFIVVDSTADLVREAFESVQSIVAALIETISGSADATVSVPSIENVALQLAWSIEGFVSLILNFDAIRIHDCHADFDATFVSRSTILLGYFLHIVIATIYGIGDLLFNLMGVASQMLYNISNSLLILLSNLQPIWKSLGTFLNGETINIQYALNGLCSILSSSLLQLSSDLIAATDKYVWSLGACINSFIGGPLDSTVATANSVTAGFGKLAQTMSSVTANSILSVSQQMSTDFEKYFQLLETDLVKSISYVDILYARIKDPVTPAVHILKYALRSLAQTIISFDGAITLASIEIIEAATMKCASPCHALVYALLQIIEGSATNKQVAEYIVKSASVVQLVLSITIGIRNFIQQLTGTNSQTLNRFGYVLSRTLNHLSTFLAPICIDSSTINAEFGHRNSDNIKATLFIMKSSISLEVQSGISKIPRNEPWTLDSTLNGMLDGPLSIIAYTINSKMSMTNDVLVDLNHANSFTLPICLQKLSLTIFDLFSSIKTVIPNIAALSPFTSNDFINSVFAALVDVEITLQVVLQTLINISDMDVIKSRIYPLLSAIRKLAVTVFYPNNYNSVIEWAALTVVLGGFVHISFNTLSVFSNVLDRISGTSSSLKLVDIQSILVEPIGSMLHTCSKIWSTSFYGDSRAIDLVDKYTLKADSILTALYSIISISEFSESGSSRNLWPLSVVTTSLNNTPIKSVSKSVEVAISAISKPSSLLQMVTTVSEQFDSILMSLSDFSTQSYFQYIQDEVTNVQSSIETMLKSVNADFESGTSTSMSEAIINIETNSIASSCQLILETMLTLSETSAVQVKLSTAFQVTSFTLAVSCIFEIVSKVVMYLYNLIRETNETVIKELYKLNSVLKRCLAAYGILLNGIDAVLASPLSTLQSFIGQLAIGFGSIVVSFGVHMPKEPLSLPPSNMQTDIFVSNMESAVSDVQSIEMRYATAKSGTQNLQKLNSVIVIAFKRLNANIPRIKIPSEWLPLTKPFISLIPTLETRLHVIVDKLILKITILTNGAVLNFEDSIYRLYTEFVSMTKAVRQILQNCISTDNGFQVATYLTILHKNILNILHSIVFGIGEFINGLTGITFDYISAFATRLAKSISILEKPLRAIPNDSTLFQKKNLIAIENSLSLIYSNVEPPLTRFETSNKLRTVEWISVNLNYKLIDLPISALIYDVTFLSNEIRTSIGSVDFEFEEFIDDLKFLLDIVISYPLLSNSDGVQSGAILELLGQIDVTSIDIEETGADLVKKFKEYTKIRSLDSFNMMKREIYHVSEAFQVLTLAISKLTDVSSEIGSAAIVKMVTAVMISYWCQLRGSQAVVGAIKQILTNSEYKPSKSIIDFEQTLSSAQSTITHCLAAISDDIWNGEKLPMTEYLLMVNLKVTILLSSFISHNEKTDPIGISADVGTFSWNILFHIAHIENLTIGNNVYAVNTAVSNLKDDFTALANAPKASGRTATLLYNIKTSMSPAFTSILATLSKLKIPNSMSVLLQSIVTGIGDVKTSLNSILQQLMFTCYSAKVPLDDVFLDVAAAIQNLTMYISYIIKSAAGMNDMDISTSLTYVGFSFGSILQIVLSTVSGSFGFIKSITSGGAVNKILFDLEKLLSVSILYISDMMGSFTEIYDKLQKAIDSILSLFNANFSILSKSEYFLISPWALSGVLMKLIGTKLSVFSSTISTEVSKVNKLSEQIDITHTLTVQTVNRLSAASIKTIYQMGKSIFSKSTKSFATVWAPILTTLTELEATLSNLIQISDSLSTQNVNTIELAIIKLCAIIPKLFATITKFIATAITVVTIESSILVAAITLVLGSVLQIIFNNLTSVWNLCWNVVNVKSKIISGSIATIVDILSNIPTCYSGLDYKFSLESVQSFLSQVNSVLGKITLLYLPKLSTLEKSVDIVADGRLGDVNGIFGSFMNGSTMVSIRSAVAILSKTVTDVNKLAEVISSGTASSSVSGFKNLTSLLGSSWKFFTAILSKFTLRAVEETIANVQGAADELIKLATRAVGLTNDGTIESAVYAAARTVSVIQGLVHLVRITLANAANATTPLVGQLAATLTVIVGSVLKIFLDIISAIGDLFQKCTGAKNKILSRITISLATALSMNNLALENVVPILNGISIRDKLVNLNDIMSMVSLKLSAMMNSLYILDSLKANKYSLDVPLSQLSAGSFGTVTTILDVAIFQIDRISRPMAFVNTTSSAAATEIVTNLNVASVSIFKIIGKTLNTIDMSAVELNVIGKFGVLIKAVGSNIETLTVRFLQTGLTKSPAVSVIEGAVLKVISSIQDVMSNVSSLKNGGTVSADFLTTLTIFLGAVVQIAYNIIANLMNFMSTITSKSNKLLIFTVKALQTLMEGFILHIVNLVNNCRTKNYIKIKNNINDNYVKMEYYYSDFDIAMKSLTN